MEYADRGLDLAVARLAAANARGDAVPAASALGRERGGDGIGLGQALDDLELVHRVVTNAEPSPMVVRAFADAWADAAVTVLLGRGALDHRTGLATIEFLATRLRDVARTGASAGHRLVVVHSAKIVRGRLGALLSATRVASELARSFPAAETPVGLADSRIVALTSAEDITDANLARARVAIRRIPGVAVDGLDVLELPQDEGDVGEFLRGL